MELVWRASRDDVRRLRTFMAAADGDPLVQLRKRRNLAASKRSITKPAFWHALIGCLLTSQQRSGPTSPVARFMRLRPFPLAYPLSWRADRAGARITRTLSEFGGIRMSTRIGTALALNLSALEDGLWSPVLTRLNGLRRGSSAAHERDVADFLADSFSGLGPKQSRNLLQALALTRYEIPIDSRITKWLNEFGFPFKLTAEGLADRHYFGVVSQGIQSLCKAAGVYPYVFDAAVFASFDAGGWTVENAEEWGHDE